MSRLEWLPRSRPLVLDAMLGLLLCLFGGRSSSEERERDRERPPRLRCGREWRRLWSRSLRLGGGVRERRGGGVMLLALSRILSRSLPDRMRLRLRALTLSRTGGVQLLALSRARSPKDGVSLIPRRGGVSLPRNDGVSLAPLPGGVFRPLGGVGLWLGVRLLRGGGGERETERLREREDRVGV